MEGRGKFKARKKFFFKNIFLDDFFCVDPKSFSIEQLNEYKKEMVRCKKILNKRFLNSRLISN